MNTALSLLTIVLCFNTARAAQPNEHWFKVESKSPEKIEKNNEEYHYDSVENDFKKQHFPGQMIWALRPRLSFSTGFHADKSTFSKSEMDRFFINSSLQFYVKPTHRWRTDVQLLQNNSLFVGTSLEFTPKRTASRDYYGFGLAHLLIADKEFSNFVEFDDYYATAHYGYEYLLKNQSAFSIEAKAYLSSNNYALQFSVAYIIPL